MKKIIITMVALLMVSVSMVSCDEDNAEMNLKVKDISMVEFSNTGIFVSWDNVNMDFLK